jgi:hypothetical protein
MKFCIAGDSWGCGEWGADGHGQYTILHTGLEFFLKQQQHQVRNVSMGSASNNFAIGQLTHVLQHDNFDHIFWFQTDPLRDITNLLHEENITFDRLLEENRQQMDRVYRALNKLEVKIHCIGGCSKLDQELMAQYPNLIAYIPSVTEWLEPDYVHPAIWTSWWEKLIVRQLHIDSLDQLVKCKKMQDQLTGYKKYFQPDGRHPNRLGHQMLFDKISKDFKL